MSDERRDKWMRASVHDASVLYKDGVGPDLHLPGRRPCQVCLSDRPFSQSPLLSSTPRTF